MEIKETKGNPISNMLENAKNTKKAIDTAKIIKENISTEFIEAIDNWQKEHPNSADEILRVIALRVQTYAQSEFSIFFYKKLNELGIIGTKKEITTLSVILDRILYGTIEKM